MSLLTTLSTIQWAETEEEVRKQALELVDEWKYRNKADSARVHIQKLPRDQIIAYMYNAALSGEGLGV